MKLIKRRIPALLLALVLTCTLTPAALATEEEALFPAVREYSGFSDVPADSWYAPYVEACYEAGLLNGTGDNKFSPDQTLTLAEGIALAARLYSCFQGRGGEIPDYPEDLNDMVRFLDADGNQVGNLSDAQGWGGNLFICFTPDFFGRVDPNEPLVMVLDVAGLDWSSFDMDPDGPLFYSGVYTQEETDAANTLEGYYFDVGEDFRGDLYEALIYLDYFFIEGSGASELGGVWYRDTLLYFFYNCGGDSLNNFGEGHDLDRWAAAYEEGEQVLSEFYSSEPCLRQDFALFLYDAAESQALQPIRMQVPPDTDKEAVLALYQAGILNGVDQYGTFHGTGTLTRAEAAAMLARIIRPELRLKAEPAQGTLAYTLERLPDSYQEAVSMYPNWAAWCDLTAVADAAGQVTYLYTVGSPVGNLDPSFPGCTYLSAALTNNDSQGWGTTPGVAPGGVLTGPYVEGIAPVRLADGSYGYCDEAGKLVIAPDFLMAGGLVAGTAIVQCQDGGWYRLTLDTE